jgi:hypothetical protein
MPRKLIKQLIIGKRGHAGRFVRVALMPPPR